MATDYFKYSGDRHTPSDAQALPPSPLQTDAQPGPPAQVDQVPADGQKPGHRSKSICDWRPDPNSPQAKQWNDAALANSSQPLQLNQDGTYTARYGDSLRGIAERELHSSGKQATKKEIDVEEQRLIALNRDTYKTLDCNKHFIGDGWKLKVSGDLPAQPAPPVEPPRRVERQPVEPAPRPERERVEPLPRPQRRVEAAPPPVNQEYLGPPPNSRPYPQRYQEYREAPPPPAPLPIMPFLSLFLGGGRPPCPEWGSACDRGYRPRYEHGYRDYDGDRRAYPPFRQQMAPPYYGDEYQGGFQQQGWQQRHRRSGPTLSLGFSSGNFMQRY